MQYSQIKSDKLSLKILDNIFILYTTFYLTKKSAFLIPSTTGRTVFDNIA